MPSRDDTLGEISVNYQPRPDGPRFALSVHDCTRGGRGSNHRSGRQQLLSRSSNANIIKRLHRFEKQTFSFADNEPRNSKEWEQRGVAVPRSAIPDLASIGCRSDQIFHQLICDFTIQPFILRRKRNDCRGAQCCCALVRFERDQGRPMS